jgi:hypothetical protein
VCDSDERRENTHAWGMRDTSGNGNLDTMRRERLAAFFHYLRIGRWAVAWEILRGSSQAGGTRSG